MEYIIALVLGIIQGLTEFLPVSSSGHLELAKYLLADDSIGEESLLMTIVLHFGTAIATLIYFKEDIVDILKNLTSKGDKSSMPFTLKIILSMVPAALIGILFNDQIESFFSQNIRLVCSMLIVTAVLLFMADRAKTTDHGVNWWQALLIGIAQAIAILPGISRSGATIATSTLLGIDRSKAARFSFLMVVPLIFAKMGKDILDGDLTEENINLGALTIGFLAALVTGYFACKWMIALVKQAKLSYFGIYCLIVGIAGLIFTHV